VLTRPSRKDSLGEDKAFGSGEGKMDYGARREVELGFKVNKSRQNNV
jgi:hypothetical protein